MQEKTLSSALEMGALLGTLGAAALLFWVHGRQPYAEPSRTVEGFFRSSNAKDLRGLQAAATTDHYAAFARHFGEEKLRRVEAIYRRVEQLGEPSWRQYRNRADAQAMNAYEALRAKVASLGQQAFAKLPVEERMRLINDPDGPAKHAAFLIDQGVQALAPEERSRIPSVEDFRAGGDRGAFADREGWNLLSAEDRAALGSVAALSRTPTPERAAFIDKAGLAQLDPKLKAEIAGIERRELADPEGFKYKYGEPLAGAYFENAKIPRLGVAKPCAFPREDAGGSLLRGEIADCDVSVPATQKRREVAVRLRLRKQGFRWLVQAIQPALYEINW